MPVSSYECDQTNSSPNDGSDGFFGIFTEAITSIFASAAGDVFDTFSVTQPDAKLFLSFLDTSYAVLSTVDLSTVGSSVTAPTGTAWFSVSCVGATLGASYNVNFNVNSAGSFSYSVFPDGDGVSYDTSFQFEYFSGGTGTSYPLGDVVATVKLTNSGPDLGMGLIWYDAAYSVLATVTFPIASGSGHPIIPPITYAAPSGQAHWSVQILGGVTGDFGTVYILNASTPPPTGGGNWCVQGTSCVSAL